MVKESSILAAVALLVLLSFGDGTALEAGRECMWEHQECMRPRTSLGMQWRLAIRQVHTLLALEIAV